MKRTKNKKQNKDLQQQWSRIDSYFEFFDREGPAEDLWKMLKLALISDNDNIDPRDRTEMLFYYEQTKELFENIYVILQQQKENLNR